MDFVVKKTLKKVNPMMNQEVTKAILQPELSINAGMFVMKFCMRFQSPKFAAFFLSAWLGINISTVSIRRIEENAENTMANHDL